MATTIILDAGHGGISPGGFYLTPGKQSPFVPPGIYEGEFNQAIVERLGNYMERDEIAHVALRPGALNVPEKNRVIYANALHKALGGGTIYVSIHANAQRVPAGEWGAANGNTVFHYRFSKESERLANLVSTSLEGLSEDTWSRGVKKSTWMRVLRKTAMPAVLVECGFMTNEREAILLRSESFRNEIAFRIYSGLTAYMIEDGGGSL